MPSSYDFHKKIKLPKKETASFDDACEFIRRLHVALEEGKTNFLDRIFDDDFKEAFLSRDDIFGPLVDLYQKLIDLRHWRHCNHIFNHHCSLSVSPLDQLIEDYKKPKKDLKNIERSIYSYLQDPSTNPQREMYFAAKEADERGFQILLKAGLDVNLIPQNGTDGEALIVKAARQPNAIVVQAILETTNVTLTPNIITAVAEKLWVVGLKTPKDYLRQVATMIKQIEGELQPSDYEAIARVIFRKTPNHIPENKLEKDEAAVEFAGFLQSKIPDLMRVAGNHPAIQTLYEMQRLKGVAEEARKTDVLHSKPAIPGNRRMT